MRAGWPAPVRRAAGVAQGGRVIGQQGGNVRDENEHPLAQSSPPVTVQVFGSRKNADTRKALRFFAERRVPVHFVDFSERGASPGELRRFIEKFGVTPLVDRESRRFAELGLAHSRYSDSWWASKLVDEPLLIRAPLVRYGNRLTVGLTESEWRGWMGG